MSDPTADLLFSPSADFFRCQACGCWSEVLKGTDALAARTMLGNPKSAISHKEVRLHSVQSEWETPAQVRLVSGSAQATVR